MSTDLCISFFKNVVFLKTFFVIASNFEKHIGFQSNQKYFKTFRRDLDRSQGLAIACDDVEVQQRSDRKWQNDFEVSFLRISRDPDVQIQ